MSNTAIWDALAKTDPAHTKSFSRAGGFKGTAVKPIYCDQKMTQQFGPCGKGWGMGAPSFQVVPGHNGEVLVYCTVELWWDAGAGRNSLYGVGGDKAVTYIKANQQYNKPERWENDDEAFKKAFTDAIGNAMKHLGMSADVHMGMFDDNKYVKELQEEFADNGGAQRKDPPPSSGTASKTEGAPSLNESRRQSWEAWVDGFKADMQAKEPHERRDFWVEQNGNLQLLKTHATDLYDGLCTWSKALGKKAA
jgi:hypothetical protein